MNSIDNLCGFVSDDDTTDAPVVLPEPSLPPRVPGGAPVPLTEARKEAEAAAAEQRAVACKAGNGYPFLTKSEIRSRAQTDWQFACDCLLVVFARQTDDEVVDKETKHKNRMGFMSSHAVHGTRIGQLLVNGETLEDEDQGRVWAMAHRYSKQLASHFRNVQLRKARETGDTALIEQAAKFGIGII
jgi:hypothetical protein